MSKYVSPLEYDRKVFNQLFHDCKIMYCSLCNRYYEGDGYKEFPYYNIAFCEVCRENSEELIKEKLELKTGFIKMCNELISLTEADEIVVGKAKYFDKGILKTFAIYENDKPIYSTNSMKALLNRLNRILVNYNRRK